MLDRDLPSAKSQLIDIVAALSEGDAAYLLGILEGRCAQDGVSGERVVFQRHLGRQETPVPQSRSSD